MKDEISNVSLWFKVVAALFLLAVLLDAMAARWLGGYFPSILK